MRSWIDGDRTTPCSRPHRGAVEQHLLLRLGTRNLDRERRNLRLESGKVLACDFETIGTIVTARDAQRLLEVRPRRRKPALLFMAHGQIQERAPARIESLTLRKLRARVREVAGFHQAPAVLEQG